MKYLLLILLLSCTAPKDIYLTVASIQETGGKRVVYARRGYQVYRATFQFGSPADSLKRGSKIRAGWSKDSCEYVFRRIK